MLEIEYYDASINLICGSEEALDGLEAILRYFALFASQRPPALHPFKFTFRDRAARIVIAISQPTDAGTRFQNARFLSLTFLTSLRSVWITKQAQAREKIPDPRSESQYIVTLPKYREYKSSSARRPQRYLTPFLSGCQQLKFLSVSRS